MCMEVSVSAGLTAPPRLAVPRPHFPAHCLVTNAGFILVKVKKGAALLFPTPSSPATARAVLLTRSERALIDGFMSPAIFLLRICWYRLR